MRALGLAVSAVVLAACAGGARRGEPAPSFASADFSGGTARPEDFGGRVILVDFWASWCDPCKNSMPEFERLWREKSSSGLVVVGIAEDETPEAARKTAAERGVDYPIGVDRDGAARAAYGARSLPTTVLIGADGKVRARWTGFAPGTMAEIEREVEAALAARPQ